MRPPLRPVGPDEKPPQPEKPKTLGEAIEGSRLDVLAAMRRALTKKIEDGDVSSNAIASVFKELRELDRLIRDAQAAEEGAEEVSRGSSGGDGAFDSSAI